jgi:glycerol dehydrogenase
MAYPLEQGRIHKRPLAVLASPGRYVQGPGATNELGRELKRLGLANSVLFIVAEQRSAAWLPSGKQSCHP